MITMITNVRPIQNGEVNSKREKTKILDLIKGNAMHFAEEETMIRG